MRVILGGALLLLLPFWGSGSISGNLGFRAGWQGGTDVAFTGLLNLSWSWDVLSLGASFSLPFPELTWGLTLRGSLDLEPLRLSVQGGFTPSGLSHLRKTVAFSSDAWEFPWGAIAIGARFGLDIRDPLGTPSLTATGEGSAGLSWEDIRIEAGLSLDLYPPPLSLRGVVLSLGYSPYPFWITVANRFREGWEYSTAEVGYQESPLRVSVQTTFGPEGFRRASLFFSLSPDPLRFSLGAGVTPQGLSPVSLSLGFVGEWVELYLRADVAFPLELRTLSLEVRIPF